MTCNDKEDKREPDRDSGKGPRLPKCYQAYIDTCRKGHVVEDDCMYENKNDSREESR
jgi:hypothetical protein